MHRGHRVVNSSTTAAAARGWSLSRSSKKINGWEFQNFGAHSDDFKVPYLTTAVAVGSRKEELVLFLERLEIALQNYWKALGESDKKEGA